MCGAQEAESAMMMYQASLQHRRYEAVDNKQQAHSEMFTSCSLYLM